MRWLAVNFGPKSGPEIKKNPSKWPPPVEKSKFHTLVEYLGWTYNSNNLHQNRFSGLKRFWGPKSFWAHWFFILTEEFLRVSFRIVLLIYRDSFKINFLGFFLRFSDKFFHPVNFSGFVILVSFCQLQNFWNFLTLENFKIPEFSPWIRIGFANIFTATSKLLKLILPRNNLMLFLTKIRLIN